VDDPALSVLHIEAGGEGDAAPPIGGEGIEPAPERITVSPDRRRHILVGDKTVGGHRPGLENPAGVNLPRDGQMTKSSARSKTLQTIPIRRKHQEHAAGL
jgi:hypothetical protein